MISTQYRLIKFTENTTVKTKTIIFLFMYCTSYTLYSVGWINKGNGIICQIQFITINSSYLM